MITQVLHCPYCHETDMVKHGLSPEGKQRYRCRTCLEGRGRTFIADAPEADHALVQALGADIVVRRGDDVATRMLEHFPHGVDGLADGAVLNDKVIPAVRDGGAFTSVRGFIGAPQRGIRFTATTVRTYDGAFEKLDRLRQLVESGAITLRVAATYPQSAPLRRTAGWRRVARADGSSSCSNPVEALWRMARRSRRGKTTRFPATAWAEGCRAACSASARHQFNGTPSSAPNWVLRTAIGPASMAGS